MQQAANSIVMVRPNGFGFNHQTQDDNAFQAPHTETLNVSKQARLEFDHYLKILRNAHIKVIVVEDSYHPQKPDAIFPNNWFSTHHDGTVITYPMYSEIRRAERENPVLSAIDREYKIQTTHSLTHYESRNIFLEGTGSIIFDHINKIAYACRSRRTDEGLFNQVCKLLNYKPVIFNAKGENNIDIYHTNVILSITSKLAIICAESLPPADEEKVIELLTKDREILLVSYPQMHDFCCNVLEVTATNGDSVLSMSTRAFKSFDDSQIELIEQHHKIVHSDLTTIENVGGGGSRCMMAEVFLELN